MEILIDALSAREGGGITYIRNILPALVEICPEWKIFILLSLKYQKDLIDELPKGIQAIIAELSPSALISRWLYLQVVVPRLIRKYEFDLLFTVAETGTLYVSCPTVVLVRNPNFYAKLSTLPNIRSRLKLLKYRLTRFPFVYLTLKLSNRLVFVSDTFRQQITKQLKLDLSKTRVVHHGLNPLFHINNSNICSVTGKVRSPYILSVSSVVQHKNYEILLLSFSKFKSQQPLLGVRLVIAGTIEDGSYYKFLINKVCDLGISEDVRFLGKVAYDELPSLYRRAVAFILPSRLETFGHPLVEAMASGTPVIATDLMVCREICEDAALYFNPDDSEMLAKHIFSVMNNPNMVKEMIAKGLQRARSFSWEKTAQKMIEIFEEVVREDMPYPQSR